MNPSRLHQLQEHDCGELLCNGANPVNSVLIRADMSLDVCITIALGPYEAGPTTTPIVTPPTAFSATVLATTGSREFIASTAWPCDWANETGAAAVNVRRDFE